MADRRLVYSTEAGRVCPACGWPASDCKCSARTRQAAVPARLVAKLRIEKAGRGGKTVTVVDGLPRNEVFLKELLQDLKRACGCGGALRDGGVELQGDLRERVRAWLTSRGHGVKG
jgi:translation initiation factor 1